MPAPTPPAPLSVPPQPPPPSADPDYAGKYRRPPFVKRLRWMFLLFLLPIPCWIWLWPGPPGWQGPLYFFFPQFVVVGIIGVVYRRAKRRVARVVKASDGRACWYCVYDLSGLAETGVCPECGSPYEHDELRRRWRAADW